MSESLPIITKKADPEMEFSCLDVRYKDGLIHAQDIHHVELSTGSPTVPSGDKHFDQLLPISDQSVGGSAPMSPDQSIWSETATTGFGAGAQPLVMPSIRRDGSDYRPNRIITCYNCKQEGHVFRDCPAEHRPRNGPDNRQQRNGVQRHNRFSRPIGQRLHQQYDTPSLAAVDGDQSVVFNDDKPESVVSEPVKEKVTDLFPQLPVYHLSRSLSDVSFVVDGHTLFGHKFVLSAKCPAFERILYGKQQMDTNSDDLFADCVDKTAEEVNKSDDPMDVEMSGDKEVSAEETESSDKISDEKQVVNEINAENDSKDVKTSATDERKDERPLTETLGQKYSVSDDRSQMEIKDTNVEAFKLFLRFFYFGGLDLTEVEGKENSISIVRDVLKLSIDFQMSGMTEVVENYLKRHKKFESLVDIYKLAIDYGLKRLIDSLDQFVRENGQIVIKNNHFVCDSTPVIIKMFSAMKSNQLVFRGIKKLMEVSPELDPKTFLKAVDMKRCVIADIDAMDLMKLMDRNELYDVLRKLFADAMAKRSYNQY